MGGIWKKDFAVNLSYDGSMDRRYMDRYMDIDKILSRYIVIPVYHYNDVSVLLKT